MKLRLFHPQKLEICFLPPDPRRQVVIGGSYCHLHREGDWLEIECDTEDGGKASLFLDPAEVQRLREDLADFEGGRDA